MDAPLDRLVAHQNEVPRLHETNRGRVMGRPENPRQDLIGNGVGQELATDVAAVENAFVDRGLFFRREGRAVFESYRFHDVPFHEKSRLSSVRDEAIHASGRSSD